MRKELVSVAVGTALSVVACHVMSADTVGEISRLQGSAMISQGEHFVAASEGTELKALDRLMVLEDSNAVLQFADGCEYVMQENEFLTIGSTSVCVQDTSGDPGSQSAARSTAGAAQKVATSAAESGPFQVPFWLGSGTAFGAVAFAGLVATGAAANTESERPGQDNFPPPLSP